MGMQSALDSAIGLPSRSTSALWMVVLVMPLDVKKDLHAAPESLRIRTP